MAGFLQASEDLRILNGQRQRPPPQTERDLVCSMNRHHAIAQAALQASAEEPDAAAEATVGMQQALQSLMQDMKVLCLAKPPPPPPPPPRASLHILLEDTGVCRHICGCIVVCLCP